MSEDRPIIPLSEITLDRKIVSANRVLSKTALTNDMEFNLIERTKDQLVFELKKHLLSYKDFKKEISVPFTEKVDLQPIGLAIHPSGRNQIFLVLSVLLMFLSILERDYLGIGFSIAMAFALIWINQVWEVVIQPSAQEVSGTIDVNLEREITFPESTIVYPEGLGGPVRICTQEPLGVHLAPIADE